MKITWKFPWHEIPLVKTQSVIYLSILNARENTSNIKKYSSLLVPDALPINDIRDLFKRAIKDKENMKNCKIK